MKIFLKILKKLMNQLLDLILAIFSFLKNGSAPFVLLKTQDIMEKDMCQKNLKNYQMSML